MLAHTCTHTHRTQSLMLSLARPVSMRHTYFEDTKRDRGLARESGPAKGVEEGGPYPTHSSSGHAGRYSGIV
jgi:hypothetical protein